MNEETNERTNERAGNREGEGQEEVMTRREREKRVCFFFFFLFSFFTSAKIRLERQSEKANKRIEMMIEYELC